MKTINILDLTGMVDLLRQALPSFGHDLDAEAEAPVKVGFGQADLRFTAGRRAEIDVNKVVVSVSVRTAAPWLPEGSYKSVLPCDLVELREILQHGLISRGIRAEKRAEKLGFAIQQLIGAPQLVLEYLA
jgi:hypothetical protein